MLQIHAEIINCRCADHLRLTTGITPNKMPAVQEIATAAAAAGLEKTRTRREVSRPARFQDGASPELVIAQCAQKRKSRSADEGGPSPKKFRPQGNFEMFNILATVATDMLAESEAKERKAAAEAALAAERERGLIRTQADLRMTKKKFAHVRACIAAQEAVDAAAAELAARRAARAQAAWCFLAGEQQIQRRGREIQELEATAAHSAQQAELRLKRAALEVCRRDAVGDLYGVRVERVRLEQAKSALAAAQEEKAKLLRAVPRAVRQRAVAGGALTDDWAV
eukprot:jgi/Ulvmu1/2162/UM013_0005.1